MDPVIFFLFGIPKSIFLPLFILTMGIGFGQKIVFGVFSTALIVTMNAVAAVRSIKPEHRLVARSYAASRWQTARLVYWPSMLPVLLDGWRTALIFAVTAIMLAEIYAARAGFGHRLADWGENFDLTRLFGGVLLVSLAAIAANESIRWLESTLQRVAAMTAAIEIRGVGHSYPGRHGATRALDDITLSIPPGRFTVLVGPSGCGKSSLLMMLAGLNHPNEGNIACAGAPMTAPDPDRVGVVFQDANLFPWLDAIDNVAFPLALRGMAKPARRNRAREMLSLVGLDGFGERHPHELSGGDAPARFDRARPGAGSAGAADGRAVRRAGRADPHDHGRRVPAHLVGDQQDDRLRHPQPDRGRLPGRRSAGVLGPAWRIIDRIDVDLPRPRTYAMTGDPRFATLRDRIWQQIRAP